MPPSLPSLLAELVTRVVEELSIEDACNLRSTSTTLYKKSKYAFDKKTFTTLSINLSRKSLRRAKEFLKDERSSRFLRKILIRLDQVEDDLYLNLKRERKRLIVVLTKGLEVSPKCDTIIIYDSRHLPIDQRRDIAAEAIETIVEQAEPFKVQLQNIWPENMEERWISDEFLGKVQTLELKFDEWAKRTRLPNIADLILSDIISPAWNLKELSLNASGRVLSSGKVKQMTEKVQSKKLRSLTIIGLETCEAELREILHPFRDSIKEITLVYIIFKDMSWGEFIKYIRKHFSLDYIQFYGIEEWVGGFTEERDGGRTIVEEVKLYRDEIKEGLDNMEKRYRNNEIVGLLLNEE
jgi:hypothetical protein